MSDGEYRIFIGTQGWDHPNWRGSYYPDDLPSEWALTYYANEMPVVYLPAIENWQDQTEQLLDDSNEKFRFIVGIDAAQLMQQQNYQQTLSLFAERLMGVVIRLDEVAPLTSDLSAAIRELNPNHLCIDYGHGVTVDAGWQDFMQQENINPCRYADNGDDVAMPGKLAVTFAEQDYDPKALRQVLEGCIKFERGDLTQALILTSATPSLETIRNGYVIADLL